MKISIIVSIANNNCIGGNNTLLWKQSNDLKRFKELTTGKVVIMGQKTYESLPNGPLPNRTNIIISDDDNFNNPYGTYRAKSIKHSLDVVKGYVNMYKKEEDKSEIFIIGGGSIYRQFLPLASKLYITRINADVEGDTYFPELDDSWKITFKEPHEKDEKNQYDYIYEVYEKIN